MKKVAFLIVAAGIGFGVSSCQKCSNCTSVSTETGEPLAEEICDTGKSYDNSIEVYERNGWVCTEK